MMNEQQPASGARPPRDRAARKRRPGLPEPRGRTTPLWIYALLALLGVGAVIATMMIDKGDEPEAAPVPLYVKVVGSGDVKLPGVTVDFYSEHEPDEVVHRTTTDETGVAILPVEKARGTFFVVARAMNGTVSVSQVREGDRTLTLLELLPAGRVEGEVVTMDGKGIHGAEVEVRFRLPECPVLATATTDANGGFSFDQLSTGMPALLLRARAEDYAWRSREWSRQSGEGPRIVMARTVDIAIQLLDSKGEPIVGATAGLRDHPGRESISDEQGFVRFPGLPAKQPVLLQVDDAERTYRFRNDLEPSREPYQVVLEEPATLEGIVVDRDDRAMSDVTIRHRHGPRAWVATRTDQEGRFTIGDLPSGEVWLEYEVSEDVTDRFTVDLARGETKAGFILRITN